jgi:hypothetical protein
MKQIFEEIKAIPGVLGVFSLHAKKGILHCSVPPLFKPEKLLEVSRQLLKIYTVTRMNLKAMQDISLHFDGSVLVLRQLTDLLFLVVICEPQVNFNMLSMSLSLVAEELPSEFARAENPPPQPAATSPKALKEIRQAGPLVAPLKKIEDALSQLMGPVAGLILEEAIEEWFSSGNASFEGLPSLVGVLSREMGDPQKVQEFQDLIGPYGQSG